MTKHVAVLDDTGNETTAEGAFAPVFGSMTEGVLRGLKVVQRGAGANMSVDIAAGWALIEDDTGTYHHAVYSTETENIEVPAADSTNPRKDLVVAYVDVDAGASNNNEDALVFAVVEGTAASSPTEPDSSAIETAVGAGNPYIILALIDVGASASSIVDADITDRRTGARARIFDYFLDRNDEEVLEVGNVASPVNWLKLSPSATGQPLKLEAIGSDSDISISLIPKGSGTVNGAPYLRNVEIFTSTDTWTKPSAMTTNGFVEVIVIGGGGGGGGGAAAGASNSAAGGAGGAGGYSRKKIAAGDLDSTETVTIGTGGSGATAGNNAGSNGNASSFGSHCSANGGNGGSGMQAESGNRVAAGGTGGSATGGDINISGQGGATARVHGGWPFPAPGGDTPLGMGGVWQSGAGGAGVAGRGYGAGGGGGVSFADSTARAGGNGADGIVIVYEYY